MTQLANMDCLCTMWHEAGPTLAEDSGIYPLSPKDDECHECV